MLKIKWCRCKQWWWETAMCTNYFICIRLQLPLNRVFRKVITFLLFTFLFFLTNQSFCWVTLYRLLRQLSLPSFFLSISIAFHSTSFKIKFLGRKSNLKFQINLEENWEKIFIKQTQQYFKDISGDYFKNFGICLRQLST